jgi:hypothetical protein
MWFPVDLHNPAERKRGLREALVACLASYPHHFLILNGEQCTRTIASDTASAEDFVQSLEKCSVAYIGARHGQPIAPYCGFSLAPELGVARIEFLVEYGALPGSGSSDKWVINAIGGFLILLFLKHPEVQQVLLPITMPEASFGDFGTQYIDGKTYAIRMIGAAK